ncbi:MAG: hypothetical protein ACLUD0_15960 [Eubacterium ramulus]
MAFAYIGRDWRNEILVGGDIVLFAVMFYIVDRLAKRKLAQKAANKTIAENRYSPGDDSGFLVFIYKKQRS